jgi:hypothetical protein
MTICDQNKEFVSSFIYFHKLLQFLKVKSEYNNFPNDFDKWKMKIILIIL